MVTNTLNRRPIPWPYRLFGWFVLTLTLLTLLALAAGVGVVSYYDLTRTSAGDVRGMIESDLPEDAKTSQVLYFLDSNEIQHGPVEPANTDNPRLRDMELQPGSMTISGFIRNDGYALELKDVEMIFVLDVNGQIVDYVVYEVTR